jgi:putative intracellular protease/amidase
LIKGKNVTGFSNEEEKIVGAEKIVPFSTEDELTKQGGNYVKGGKPWGECVVEDNRVVTGQNPGSAGACADHVLKLIK